MRRNTNAVVLLVLVASVAFAGGRAEAEHEPRWIDQAIYASPFGVVVVAADAGRIVVQAWNQPYVRVSGWVDERVDRVDLAHDGDGRVSVSVRPTDHARAGAELVETDLEVNVPNSGSVGVETLTADVEIRDVRGAVDVKSGTGDVTVRGQVRSVLVRAMSGEVVVTGPVEIVEFATLSAYVVVDHATHSVQGVSYGGDIRVAGSGLHLVDLHASRGDIDLHADLAGHAVINASLDFGGTARLSLAARTEGVFTFIGGEVSTQVDITGFRPEQPIEWLIPAEPDAGDTGYVDQLDLPTGTLSAGTKATAILGGSNVHVAGYRHGLSSTREFRVGDGTARVFVQSNSGPWDWEENGGGAEPRIILRTFE